MIALPGMISNYVNPEAKRKNTYKDFGLLLNFARDYVVVCTRPDEDRFKTFAELVEYSKKNEIIIAGTSGPGDDGIMIGLLNGLEGSDFVHFATTGTSLSLTNLYGGHVDVSIANVSEIGNPLKDGLLKVIVVASEERVKQFPDIPTVKEEIGISIVMDSSRGIITKAGVPEDALKILRDALTKALENEEVREKLANQGIDVQISNWQEYEVMMQETETLMYELGPKAFGWDLKK
jgi:tripartite-type tricarboxylate transporter receptor subunit TctC